jgi:hypothetical protein
VCRAHVISFVANLLPNQIANPLFQSNSLKHPL